VTPNAASKTYGQTDPVLTGTLTGFIPADNVVATYKRVAGEELGTYTISATLSPAGVLTNYQITYNPALFTIKDYLFTGFKSPVDMPKVVNSAQAGQAIPVKWHLTDANGMPISNPSSFVAVRTYPVSCGDFGFNPPEDPLPAGSPGDVGLIYNGNGDWHFNWKTLKTYTKGTCRDMYIEFDSGLLSPFAQFKFK
jgi:hypothetical protein